MKRGPLLLPTLLLLALAFSGCSISRPKPTAAVPTTAPTAAAAPTRASTDPPETAPPGTPDPQLLSAGDPYAPELGNSGYDVEHYTLKLALDPDTRFIEGSAGIQARSTMDDLAQVALDFVGLDIARVTLDGAPVGFFRHEGKLVVNLPALLPSGTPFTLRIDYSGEPLIEPSRYVPFVSHLGLHHQLGQGLFVVSEPDGARNWYPCNDHPRDKAGYRFELTVPSGLTGVANGVLLSTQLGVFAAFSDGRPGDIYTWEHTAPLASAFVTVAVGEYQRVEGTSPGGIPLRHYVRPEEVATMERLNPTLGEMIDWLSELLGPYPFEAFGYVTVSGLGASLETQTMVLLDSGSLGNEGTMLHEMTHMWFGDWVSLDSWAEIWRSEGFATYIPVLWETRSDPGALDERMAGLWPSPAEGSHPLNAPPPARMFGFDSYYKGAALVHSLRREIGDEAFFDGLRTYFQRYGGGTASQAQFQGVLEEAAGRPLDEFFAEWFQ